MITLGYPWLLATLPLLWFFWRSFARRWPSESATKASSALLHPHAELFATLANEPKQRPGVPWTLLLGFSALLVALAQPRWINVNDLSEHYGRDLILALDVSGSMRALDFFDTSGATIDRLSMLKQVVSKFLAQRQGDRVGIIVFGDDAYTLAPLTSDLNVLARMLQSIENGIAGEKTAVGNAIALGVERLAHRPSNSRTLILFSDGSNTTGIAPLIALEQAKQKGVRIYTVAIGRDGKVPFPRGTLDSPTLTEIPMDKNLLRHIAKETGGEFYQADITADFEQIFAQIDNRSTSVATTPKAYPYTELYHLPLMVGLWLLLWQRWRTTRLIFP